MPQAPCLPFKGSVFQKPMSLLINLQTYTENLFCGQLVETVEKKVKISKMEVSPYFFIIWLGDKIYTHKMLTRNVRQNVKTLSKWFHLSRFYIFLICKLRTLFIIFVFFNKFLLCFFHYHLTSLYPVPSTITTLLSMPMRPFSFLLNPSTS